MEDGFIHILFQQKGDFLYCITEDNGVGRLKAEKNKSELTHRINKESLGIDIISERLKLLDSAYGKSELQIIDLYNDTGAPSGTKVIIKIPIQTQKKHPHDKDANH